MDFIDRLREKPPKIKKRIAIATSALVTLVIFGVWASVFHFGSSQKPSEVTAAVANSSDTDVNPLSALWNVLSTGWGGLAKSIDQAKTGVDQAQNFVKTMNEMASTSSADASSSQSVPLSQKDVLILSGTSTNNVQTMQ